MDRIERWREVNRRLPAAFPELREAYEAEILKWSMEDEGPMIVYATVFVPLMVEALRSEPDESDLLSRIYGFMQELENDPDPETSQIATVELAGHLESDLELLKRAHPHLGPRMAAVTRAALESASE